MKTNKQKSTNNKTNAEVSKRECDSYRLIFSFVRVFFCIKPVWCIDTFNNTYKITQFKDMQPTLYLIYLTIFSKIENTGVKNKHP